MWDIRRTYPAHEYFRENGGEGQQGLYNISKVRRTSNIPPCVLCSYYKHMLPEKKRTEDVVNTVAIKSQSVHLFFGKSSSKRVTHRTLFEYCSNTMQVVPICSLIFYHANFVQFESEPFFRTLHVKIT